MRFKPDYSTAHFNLGVALFDKGDVDGAIVEYEEAIRLNPDHAKSHYWFGKALAAKGLGDEAAREFAEAQQLDPRLKPPVIAAPK